MRSEKADVVVVGGGPAGSNAAREIKKRNSELDVILLDKGREPAANCAGGLGIPFYNHMGYKPPDKTIKSQIKEVIIASPNEQTSLGLEDVDTSNVDWLDDPDEMGWVLDRLEWDKYQLEIAEEAGADIRMQRNVVDLEQNSHVELDVVDKEENEDVKFKSEYVVLANGPTWKLAIQAGFERDELEPPSSELHRGLQYEIKDSEYIDEYGKDNILLLFDRNYAPNGYTWSFTAGGDYTKWGAGVPLSHDMTVKEGLHNFLKDHGKWEMKEKTNRKTTDALIPTARPLNSCVEGNVAIVGDTAHHCDPLHGGGQMFGARAAKQIGISLSEEGNLQAYDERWKDDFLDTLQNRFILRDLIHNMSNDEYDRFIDSLRGFEVTGVNPDFQIPKMMIHCFRNDPGIFTKTAAEATRSLAKQKLGELI